MAKKKKESTAIPEAPVKPVVNRKRKPVVKPFGPMESITATTDTTSSAAIIIQVQNKNIQVFPLESQDDFKLDVETSDNIVHLERQEYDRLINTEIEYRKLTRENAVIIEEWQISGKGIRMPGSKISILTIDKAMLELSEMLKAAELKKDNNPPVERADVVDENNSIIKKFKKFVKWF